VEFFALAAFVLVARPALADEDEVVVVTASRTEGRQADAVVATDVVTREEIEASGAQDAAAILQTVPGVDVQRSFRGDGVAMQGLDPEYVLILVDGQRVIGARDGVVDLSRIPASRIERIEIVKGAASALYGSDAIAGVVNIITRTPEAPVYGEAGFIGGARDTAGGGPLLGVQGSGGVRRERWGLGLDAAWRDRPSFDLDPGDAQTDGNGVEQVNVGLQGDVSLTDTLELRAGGSYTQADATGVDEARGAVYDRRNLTEEAGAHVGVAWRKDLTRLRSAVSGSTVRDQYLADQRGSDALDSYEESVERLLTVDGQVDTWLKGGHLLSGGVEGSVAGLTSPRLSQEGERLRLGVFAQDEWRPGAKGKWALSPSARLDVDSWFGVHPTGRLALRFNPNKVVALRASGGSGFRAPSFKEMFLRFENAGVGYVVEGNPELRPESAWSVSLGAELNPGGGWRAGVDLFSNHLTDMITVGLVDASTPEAPAGAYGYLNVASARTTGGEARVGWRGPAGVDAELAYTFTDTEDIDKERPLDGRSPHRGTFTVAARPPAWGLVASARGEVVGPATFYADETPQSEVTVTDPWANLGVRVEKSFWRGRVRVFVGVDNLFGAGHALYVPLEPRLWYGGLTLAWPGATDTE
jgi:outer membrane receptor for ferrienterochelin and colicins